jgi:pilus assembly protein Flp/PilA
MRLFALLTRLGKDEDGAALLEYTVLMGLLLVATITTVTLVGGWISSSSASQTPLRLNRL